MQRRRNPRLAAYLVLLAALVAPSLKANDATSTHPPVEIAGSEVRKLVSKAGLEYEIYVKFPRGYSEGQTKYPVLYVLDAETNFGATSYIVQRLIKDEIIPNVLVVGIAYGVDYETFYRYRIRDLAPSRATSAEGTASLAGGAKAFQNFIEMELFPFISQNYRVKEDDRALYGHSLGGLFGVYTLLTKPEMFDRMVLLSPSLWWKDKAIFEEAKRALPLRGDGRVYLATGEFENRRHHGGQSMVDQQLEMAALVEKTGKAQWKIRSEILENETHRTIFGDGFTRGLRFVYPEPE